MYDAFTFGFLPKVSCATLTIAAVIQRNTFATYLPAGSQEDLTFIIYVHWSNAVSKTSEWEGTKKMRRAASGNSRFHSEREWGGYISTLPHHDPGSNYSVIGSAAHPRILPYLYSFSLMKLNLIHLLASLTFTSSVPCRTWRNTNQYMTRKGDQYCSTFSTWSIVQVKVVKHPALATGPAYRPTRYDW